MKLEAVSGNHHRDIQIPEDKVKVDSWYESHGSELNVDGSTLHIAEVFTEILVVKWRVLQNLPLWGIAHHRLVISSSMEVTLSIMITIRNVKMIRNVLQVQGGSWWLFFLTDPKYPICLEILGKIQCNGDYPKHNDQNGKLYLLKV